MITKADNERAINGLRVGRYAHPWVHMHMSKRTRRVRYRVLRRLGYNSYEARRIRDLTQPEYIAKLRTSPAKLATLAWYNDYTKGVSIG